MDQEKSRGRADGPSGGKKMRKLSNSSRAEGRRRQADNGRAEGVGHPQKKHMFATKGKRGNKAKAYDRGEARIGSCAVAARCGGCRWIRRSYPEQVAAKREAMARSLAACGYTGAWDFLEMDGAWGFSHRAALCFGENPRRGLYMALQGPEGELVPLEGCPVWDGDLERLAGDIGRLLASFRIKAYQRGSGFGLMRGLFLRKSHATGEIMVVLLATSPILPSKNNLAAAIRALHPGISSILLDVQDPSRLRYKGGQELMAPGERQILLWGGKTVQEQLLGVRMPLGAGGYFPSSPAQWESLVERALPWLSAGKTMLCLGDRGGLLSSVLSAGGYKTGNNQSRRGQDAPDSPPPRGILVYGGHGELPEEALEEEYGQILHLSMDGSSLEKHGKLFLERGYQIRRCVGGDWIPHNAAAVLLTLWEKPAYLGLRGR